MSINAVGVDKLQQGKESARRHTANIVKGKGSDLSNCKALNTKVIWVGDGGFRKVQYKINILSV
jgi:hypothetical protein